MANLGLGKNRTRELANKIKDFIDSGYLNNSLFIIMLHDTKHNPDTPFNQTFSKLNGYNIICINPGCSSGCETDDFLTQILFEYFRFNTNNIFLISEDLFNWKSGNRCNKGLPILNGSGNISRIDSIHDNSTNYLSSFKSSLAGSKPRSSRGSRSSRR